ncbi:MAG TPA: PQQ-binding-like beta-propeller repeat protein [Gemmatimonadaceae bacterium]|jgi:outer membrane protein assembly factor BamB
MRVRVFAWCGLAYAAMSVGACTRDTRQAPDTSGPVSKHVAVAGGTGHDWTRFGVDAARSNYSTTPTGIDSTNVATMQRQQVAIDGTVDSSPIYLSGVSVGGAPHDVFFVTTTYGKTLAIDADRGTLLWEFAPPGYSTWAGSYRITTATPVADPSRAFIYAASPDGHITKLSVADGHPAWSTAITLLPEREKIASALNFFGGRVIATTGGYIGDTPPYQGHVALIDAASGQLAHVWNALCSDRTGLIVPKDCPESDAAIWGRSGAVVDSTTGDLFVTTGNSRWDGHTYWGDAVIELDRDATHVVGNYTPSNTEILNEADTDLGSTSPVLVVGSGGTMILQGGKDRHLRLLDWRTMRGSSPHRGGEKQIFATPSEQELFTTPAVVQTIVGTSVFVADEHSTAAYTIDATTHRVDWQAGSGGTSPICADGLLYVYDPSGALRVYDPASGTLMAQLPAGAGHWNSPIVADGRIALAEGDANAHRITGVLNIYRLP